MKLREAAIRLTLDDWVAAYGGLAGTGMDKILLEPPAWYGKKIRASLLTGRVMQGLGLSVKGTSTGIKPFWPEPGLLSVDLLLQLDEDVRQQLMAHEGRITSVMHDEIIANFKAFRNKVGGG